MPVPQPEPDPHRPVAMVTSPAGAAYRGKAGCNYILCTRDGNPDRCYGWHCFYCDGPSNCQGDCSNPECPGQAEAASKGSASDA